MTVSADKSCACEQDRVYVPEKLKISEIYG